MASMLIFHVTRLTYAVFRCSPDPLPLPQTRRNCIELLYYLDTSAKTLHSLTPPIQIMSKLSAALLPNDMIPMRAKSSLPAGSYLILPPLYAAMAGLDGGFESREGVSIVHLRLYWGVSMLLVRYMSTRSEVKGDVQDLRQAWLA